MKDIVRITNKLESYTTKELITAAITHFISFLVGIATTRAVVFESLIPFGISYISGVSYTYLPSAAFGVFFGYLFPVIPYSPFRYLATLFAILTVKILISKYKKITSNLLLITIITFLGFLAISGVSIKSKDITFINALTESMLCGFGTLFISKSFSLTDNFQKGLRPDELSTILICINILILGLDSFSIISISLGRVLSVLIILIASKYGGITAGCIAGVTASLTITLSGYNSNIGIAYAFSGLITGIFTPLGKYAQVIIFIIFSFIGAVTTADGSVIGTTAVETILGAVLFLTIPRRLGITIGKIFSLAPKSTMPYGYKKTLTMRLDLAANALKDVSETVEQVSEQLAKINSPDFSTVISGIEQDACSGCKLRVHCWESKRAETVEAILEMTKAIKQGECAPETALPEDFKGRCYRISKISNATFKRFSEYAKRISAESRIDEVRSVVTDQFNGISMMLKDLSADFNNDEHFDTVSVENAISALKNLNIRVVEANSRIDKYGRMTLEFKLKKTPELTINKAEVMRALSIVCERNFDVPRITQIGNEIFIIINEKADINIDIGVKQIPANDSNMCGDSYKYFYDGKGHFIMILSDGMGTGGRAAVDGAMASGLMARLITAGFGYDCSLRILNSSMLFKSTDESLATLDIACVDLYTGQLRLYKAGAAPSIVRRQGRTGKAESTSLPAGILRNVSFDKASVKCRFGDIIVLMSDGITSTGTEWIRAEIEAWRDGRAQDLAERLSECAKRRCDQNHQDDITVLVAILEKAV